MQWPGAPDFAIEFAVDVDVNRRVPRANVNSAHVAAACCTDNNWSLGPVLLTVELMSTARAVPVCGV